MKKLMFLWGIVAVGLFLVLKYSHAGQNDPYGNPRPSIWHSSRTVSADSFVFVGSTIQASVIVHSVIVNVGSALSSMTIYNATSTPVPGIILTTFTIVDTSAKEQYFFDVLLSSGFLYDKRGGADVTILWDWMSRPKVIPFKPYP